jgi:hypothetical protein
MCAPARRLGRGCTQRWAQIESEPLWSALLRQAVGDLDRVVEEWIYSGGLPQGLRMSAERFDDVERNLIKAWPVLTKVELVSCEKLPGPTTTFGTKWLIVPWVQHLVLTFGTSIEREVIEDPEVCHSERLSVLELDGCTGLKLPSNWPGGLTRLALRNCALDDNEFHGLRLYLNSIKRPFDDPLADLDLSGNHWRMGTQTLSDLVSLPSFSELVSLDLSSNRIEGELFKTIGAMPDTPRLRKLSLFNCGYAPSTEAAEWPRLRGLPDLQQLDISGNEFRDEDLEALASAPWLGQLRRLDNAGNHSEDRGLLALANSGAIHTLEALHLSSPSRRGLEALSTSESPGLVSLKLGVNPESLPSLVSILESRHSQSLRELMVHFHPGEHCGENQWRLVKALQGTSLEILHIWGFDEAVQAEILRNGSGSLRSLRIDVSRTLIEALTIVQEVPPLLELHLDGNVSLADLQRLFFARISGSLGRLGVSGRIGGELCGSIQTSCGLRWIDLTRADVEPVAERHLARILVSLPQLDTLILPESAVANPVWEPLREKLAARLRFA